jgi:hypothetical protein
LEGDGGVHEAVVALLELYGKRNFEDFSEREEGGKGRGRTDWSGTLLLLLLLLH